LLFCNLAEKNASLFTFALCLPQKETGTEVPCFVSVSFEALVADSPTIGIPDTILTIPNQQKRNK